MVFDYVWNGITFEMYYEDLSNGELDPHWTDIEFVDNTYGYVVDDNDKLLCEIEIELEYLTEEAKLEIRQGAYEKYLGLCDDPQDDDVDRACFEYHQQREES